MKALGFFAGGLGLIAATATFASQVLFDNLTLTNQYSVDAGYRGQSFITSRSTFLERVSLGLRNPSGATSTFTVELYNRAGSLPGTSLATLSGPTNPVTGIAIYTPVSPIILDAGKTYWVVAKAVGGSGSYDWVLANPTPTVGAVGVENMAWYSPGQGWSGSGNPESQALKVEVRQPTLSLLVPGSTSQFSVTELTPFKITLIQVSSNLANWTDISTNAPFTSSFIFTNSAPMVKTNNQFYRVVQLP